MSRLIDPTICPDCRGNLDAEATCQECGLALAGPLAVQLMAAMTTADRLVERLRTASPARPSAVGTPIEQPAVGAVGQPAIPTQPAQSLDPAAARPPRRRLPSASVPIILLGLGVLCVLVAAVVFVAVAWSDLGLGARTAILLALTSLMALAGVAVTRHGLRGAAEAIWLIVAGLLAIDGYAAYGADLLGLGAIGDRGSHTLVGGLLVAMGLTVATWVRREKLLANLIGAQCVAVFGALLLTASQAWTVAHDAAATTIAVPVLAAASIALRGRLGLAATGIAGLTLLSWIVLVGNGVLRAEVAAGWWAWHSSLEGWPLLAAAALAAGAATARPLPQGARTTAAAGSLLSLALLAGLGTQHPTDFLLAAFGVVVFWAAVSGFAPRPWSVGAAVLTALAIVPTSVYLLARPWSVVQGWSDQDFATAAATASRIEEPLSTYPSAPATWTAILTGLALAVALLGLARHARGERHGRDVAALIRVLVPTAVGLGVVTVLIEQDSPLWLDVTALGGSLVLAAGLAWWQRDVVLAWGAGLAATAYLATIGVRAAVAVDLTTAALLTVVALVALALSRGQRPASEPVSLRSLLSGALAAVAVGSAAAATLRWGDVAGLSGGQTLVVAAVAAGLLWLGVGVFTRDVVGRLSAEATALVVGLAAAAVAASEVTAAAVLTVTGASASLVALSRRDRWHLGWLGGAILAGAFLLRVDAGVRAPETVTVPAALVLLAAGWWRMRADRGVGSVSALGSGLSLLLGPSLLLAIDEPVSLRGLLVAVVAVAVLALGVGARMSAPLLWGAAATGVLVLSHLQPIALAIPRWVSLGTLGAVLLAVGITWEARRKNLSSAARYLTDLR